MAEHDINGQFERADTLVKSSFGELAERGVVLGAFPFGSSQFGDYSLTSDYDIIVAIEDTAVTTEMEIYRELHEAARVVYGQTSVPLEVSCFTESQFAEGLHTMPSAMLEWLKGQRVQYPESVIGKDFVGAIHNYVPKVPASPSLATADSYAASTRHTLKKEWLQGTYFRPHDLLSLVLSVPHVLGRKTVDIVSYGTLTDLSKGGIKTAVEQTLGADERLLTLYGEISEDLSRYADQFLPSVADLSSDEYDQVIEATLEDNLPKAIELIRRMQEEYRRLFNEKGYMDRARTSPYVERSSNPTDDEIYSYHVDRYRDYQMDSI